MENVDFILAFFFPLFFCFLFVFSKKSNNSKHIGLIGVLGYVFLWGLVVFEGLVDVGKMGLISHSSIFNIIDFRFGLRFEKSYFLILNIALALFNFCWFWRTRTIHEKFYQFILFLVLFFSTGALLSENVFSFLVFSEFVFVSVVLLIYSYGPKLQRNDVFKILVFDFVAFLLISLPIIFILFKGNNIFGFFSTSPLYIKNVLVSINKENYLLGSLLIFFMAIGAFIKCSFFPFHGWSQVLFLKLRKELTFPVFGVVFLLSFYYLSVFISPLVQEVAPDLKIIFLILFSLGVIFNTIVFFQKKKGNIYQYILKLFYIHISFCGLGIFLYLGNKNSLVMSHLTINFFTFFTIISLISSKTEILPLKNALINSQPMSDKAKNIFFLVFIASYSGFPLLGFFNGEIVILYNLISQDIFLGITLAFFSILPIIKTLRDMTFLNIGAGKNTLVYFDYFNIKFLAVIILLIVNVIFGLRPNLIINYLN